MLHFGKITPCVVFKYAPMKLIPAFTLPVYLTLSAFLVIDGRASLSFPAKDSAGIANSNAVINICFFILSDHLKPGSYC